MAVSCANGVCFKFSQLFILAVLCTCFKSSHQNLLKEALEKELEEELLTADISRLSRQTKTVYDASGIEQSPACGLNSLSFNRRKRDDDEPQGPYDWPWMAVFLDKNNGYAQFCGGALLNHQYILTAAHCFAEQGSEKTEKDIVVRLGEWDLYDTEETKVQEIFAAKIEVHENYETSNKQNDIALVKLERSVTYDQYIRPLCLPSIDVQPNQTLIVAGWGATETDGDHSSILLDVAVPVVAHAECQDQFGVSNSIDKDGNICAGGEIGKDSCVGDSGGPLVVQQPDDEKRWMVAGIVSWGLKCGEYTPGVYTNVRHYMQWIKTRIGDAAP